MSHEIEVKFKVENFSAVRRRLRQAGAEYLGTVLQTDCYYDLPGQIFLTRDCGLRLRTLRCLRRGAAQVDTRPLLTFKGPGKGNRRAKIRRELQARLDEVEPVEELLHAFGLEPTMRIQKRRASYRLNRSLVELDELPLMGRFIEIEAPGEKKIEEIRRRLKLEAEPITDHYINLLCAACKERGMPCREVLF